MKCCISASGHPRAVSGPGMYIIKFGVLQNESEPNSFEVHKLLRVVLFACVDVCRENKMTAHTAEGKI